MKYAWMKENAATFKISAMCRALSVSRSGYYEWLHRPLSQRGQDDQALAAQIQGHFDSNRQVYGTRRRLESVVGLNLRLVFTCKSCSAINRAIRRRLTCSPSSAKH